MTFSALDGVTEFGRMSAPRRKVLGLVAFSKVFKKGSSGSKNSDNKKKDFGAELLQFL
jgi:hypothetical protein